MRNYSLCLLLAWKAKSSYFENKQVNESVKYYSLSVRFFLKFEYVCVKSRASMQYAHQDVFFGEHNFKNL